jgi:hypothetical protein
MNILTNNINELKPSDLVDLKCEQCGKTFQHKASHVKTRLKNHPTSNRLCYCSKTCKFNTKRNKIIVICKTCSKEFLKLPSQIKKCPNNFCSQSCAGSYNSAHRTTGIRRSKAEVLIEELIKADFPDLPIQTSVRDVLESGLEIDIFLPSLNIAIELNGPVHYFPIYGQTKLEDIQNKDLRKQVELQQKGFNLIVIDISQHTYWKKSQIMLENYYQSHIKPLLNNSAI